MSRTQYDPYSHTSQTWTPTCLKFDVSVNMLLLCIVSACVMSSTQVTVCHYYPEQIWP